MSEFQKYIKLLENSEKIVEEKSNDFLFSVDAEALYESTELLLENRVNWLRDNIMHKLEPLANEKNTSIEDLFQWILDQDPTNNKQYSQWLFKILVGKNAQSSLEDVDQASDVLSKYDELKKSNSLKPEHKDLNKFKSVEELYRAIIDAEKDIKSKYDEIEQRARNESEIIHEDNVWVVVIPKTEYAAGYWGKESLWCTSTGFEGGRQEERSNNMFDNYANQSNLYTIVNKKKPSDIYQLHIATKQFMDAENERIPSLEERQRIVEHFPKLQKEINKEMAYLVDNESNFDLLVNYKELLGEIPSSIVSHINEDKIAKNPVKSYQYARDVLEKPFKKGEKAIAKDAYASFGYARNVLKDRFKAGEKAIFADLHTTIGYIEEVVKDTLVEAEKVVVKRPRYYLQYINALETKQRIIRFEKALGETKHERDVVTEYLEYFLLDSNISASEDLEIIRNINLVDHWEFLTGGDIYEVLVKYLYGVDGNEEVLDELKHQYKEIFGIMNFRIPRDNDQKFFGLMTEHFSEDEDFINKVTEIGNTNTSIFNEMSVEVTDKVIEQNIKKLRELSADNVFTFREMTVAGVDLTMIEKNRSIGFDLVESLKLIFSIDSIKDSMREEALDIAESIDDGLTDILTSKDFVVMMQYTMPYMLTDFFPNSREMLAQKYSELTTYLEDEIFDDDLKINLNYPEHEVERIASIYNKVDSDTAKLM